MSLIVCSAVSGCVNLTAINCEICELDSLFSVSRYKDRHSLNHSVLYTVQDFGNNDTA
jgi:hypothetical protein